jgi:hypothetical protein
MNLTIDYGLLRLLPHHLSDLLSSGLSERTIRAWHCYSIEADQPWVMNQLGFGHLTPPALALPILVPGQKEPDLNTVILKPDHPRRDPNGKIIKYETRSGSRNRLHVPLPCQTLLDDLSITLWITEGQKKSAKAAQEGLCCIALHGVWNWLVRISADASFPLPDFDAIALKDREIIIAFDSDSASNPSVKLASRRLAQFLVKRGARVFSVQLPEVGNAN